jgi:hypothetical protein
MPGPVTAAVSVTAPLLDNPPEPLNSPLLSPSSWTGAATRGVIISHEGAESERSIAVRLVLRKLGFSPCILRRLLIN